MECLWTSLRAKCTSTIKKEFEFLNFEVFLNSDCGDLFFLNSFNYLKVSFLHINSQFINITLLFTVISSDLISCLSISKFLAEANIFVSSEKFVMLRYESLPLILSPREHRKPQKSRTKCHVSTGHTLWTSICTGLTNSSHSANLLTNSCHYISTDGKAPWHSLINRQHPIIRQWFLDEIKLHFEKAWFSHSWVTYIWLLNLAWPKTAKKIYAASSNATSSSRVCKSEGDFSQCKNLFAKQIVRCSLPRKRFTAVPFREVNYFHEILFSPCVGPIPLV